MAAQSFQTFSKYFLKSSFHQHILNKLAKKGNCIQIETSLVMVFGLFKSNGGSKLFSTISPAPWSFTLEFVGNGANQRCREPAYCEIITKRIYRNWALTSLYLKWVARKLQQYWPIFKYNLLYKMQSQLLLVCPCLVHNLKSNRQYRLLLLLIKIQLQCLRTIWQWCQTKCMLMSQPSWNRIGLDCRSQHLLNSASFFGGSIEQF